MSGVANKDECGDSQMARCPRVVIMGGGFAGVAAAKGLRSADVDVVMLDRRNHQIFQPLLYQAATAVLVPSDITSPLRQLETAHANLAVVLAEATAIDLVERKVKIQLPNSQPSEVTFDFLVLAPGVTSSYFGHDDFASSAPSLKTLTDAEVSRWRAQRNRTALDARRPISGQPPMGTPCTLSDLRALAASEPISSDLQGFLLDYAKWIERMLAATLSAAGRPSQRRIEGA